MFRPKQERMSGLIKSREEIELMRRAGEELAGVREKLERMVRPGVTTAELDDLAREEIERLGAKPAFLNYNGYPATICASINEEIVHGIPSEKRRLREGDLISIDVGLIHYGFYSDTALTVPVGEVSAEFLRLIEVTRQALEIGIDAARPGVRLGDVSSAIQQYVEGEGLAVVREYTGHGIGRQLHEEPKVANFGTAGKGLRLRPGMVIALEPMVNLGTWGTRVLEDDWTVVTADGKASAHFEHTVALTPGGAQVLTR